MLSKFKYLHKKMKNAPNSKRQHNLNNLNIQTI